MVVLRACYHSLHFRRKCLVGKQDNVSSLDLSQELGVGDVHSLAPERSIDVDLEMGLEINFVHHAIQVKSPILESNGRLSKKKRLVDQGIT